MLTKSQDYQGRVLEMCSAHFEKERQEKLSKATTSAPEVLRISEASTAWSEFDFENVWLIVSISARNIAYDIEACEVLYAMRDLQSIIWTWLLRVLYEREVGLRWIRSLSLMNWSSSVNERREYSGNCSQAYLLDAEDKCFGSIEIDHINSLNLRSFLGAAQLLAWSVSSHWWESWLLAWVSR